MDMQVASRQKKEPGQNTEAQISKNNRNAHHQAAGIPLYLQSGNTVIQRQAIEEEEEAIQTKADTLSIQRQPLEEEEEELQAKLTIGQPNDIYEQEADRVAETVMRMPVSSD